MCVYSRAVQVELWGLEGWGGGVGDIRAIRMEQLRLSLWLVLVSGLLWLRSSLDTLESVEDWAVSRTSDVFSVFDTWNKLLDGAFMIQLTLSSAELLSVTKVHRFGSSQCSSDLHPSRNEVSAFRHHVLLVLNYKLSFIFIFLSHTYWLSMFALIEGFTLISDIVKIGGDFL